MDDDVLAECVWCAWWEPEWTLDEIGVCGWCRGTPFCSTSPSAPSSVLGSSRSTNGNAPPMAA